MKRRIRRFLYHLLGIHLPSEWADGAYRCRYVRRAEPPYIRNDRKKL